MKKELTPNEIIFLASSNEICKETNINRISKSENMLNKSVMIKKPGYNIYYIDSFSKEKLSDLVDYLQKIYNSFDKPKDICYVTSEDVLHPIPLILPNSKGKKFIELLSDIKEKYFECINDFYSSCSDEEKEEIIEDISEIRNEYVTDLITMAKAKNFDIKSTNGGFVFIPLNEDENELTQDDYDEMEEEKQYSIEKEANKLKKEAGEVLEKLKDIEIDSLNKLKDIYKNYLKENMQKYKDDFLLEFICEDSVYKYLTNMFNNIEQKVVECYSVNIEDDEEEIKDVLKKYNANLILDNTGVNSPKVIYEDEPIISNLIGNIEYKSVSGSYTTDISMINSGSLLRANGGCLILRLSSLINSGMSYYYLKKALIQGEVDYSYTKNYLEVLSIEGLKPKAIPINVKVILIGDYESFEILYEKDEDFKNIFPIKIEAENEIKNDVSSRNLIKLLVENKIMKDNLSKITDDALSEIIKYLSRIAGERSKVLIDDHYINKILYLANSNVKLQNRKIINRKDIIDIIYSDEKIIDEVMESYRKKKILITITGEKVGTINALSVIGTGSFSFGKPMRVTCLAMPGDGRIIDIHRESKMSGSIHEKSIGILQGILSDILSPYEKLPVNFQLSFEQTYGMIEGDSASVAEIICILSALSKHPIKQNIAVTGSINQLGEIQPIGGLNEKIEGFHRVCKIVDNVENKAVLMPICNVDELILNYEVENDIKDKKFHIYTMENLNDAIETLMLNENETLESFFNDIEKEILKYKEVMNK